MAKTNTDDVLADLKMVGAVGGAPKAPVFPENMVTEVEIEQGPPSVALRDLRGAKATEAIDGAVRHIDDAMRSFEGLREALGFLREVWAPVEDADEGLETVLETPQTALESVGATEAPSTPPSPPKPTEGVQEPPIHNEEAHARAREAARRKILGEDIPEGERASVEAEEAIPFVGMERALPPGQEPEETTIGTVGKIKPSFPAEE